ncbi:MAG: sigma-70 family RNA polymerase sigma factor [Synechococcales cyanobacterium RM1_1_8]|nr:sigma-70 family RNA polymerase sigma factor [Synechococcales cyanobacterium RM1_1_8]
MPLTEQPDPVVFAALRQGDLKALDVLYGRYSTPIYRLALRILKAEEEAADLTQEVFLRLWRTLGYDPARGTLLVYLMMMTRSQALNRIRQHQNQRKLAERWGRSALSLAEGGDTSGHASGHPGRFPLEALSLDETASQVRLALAQIPQAQREVLEMAYYDGLSQSEITQRLDIPLGTVKSRSRQGLLKLRQLLKDLVDSP